MAEHLNPAEIEKSLNLERFEPPEKIDWLDNSFGEDSFFWPSLSRSHDRQFSSAGKSRPFKQYDFFHDIITRNISRENPAFIIYDPNTLWQEISYQTLGKKAEKISDNWRNLGVKPGDTLCIIKPFGLGYLLSLLAGLRTGVILSFIMPQGKALIRKKLEALQPDHICTENIYLPLLSEVQDKIINEDGDGEKTSVEDRSHTYSTGEVAARLFDPMCTDLFTPKEIASDLLYLSGIRDGFIGLGLCPGDIFAAPGFNDGLTQPSFALAVLMNGATCLHISMTDITKDPNLLTIYPLKVLGICSQLRDILMEHPVRKVRIWDSWFRDPTDSSDMHVWDMFIKKLELTDIPAGCMVWNSAMGGGLLFSRRRKGQALQNVLPLPGRKWQLTMMADDTTEALGGLGHFCVAASLGKDEEVYLPTPCILMDTFLEKIFLNLTIPVRKGIYYPKKFITEVVRKIDDCKDAVIVEIQNTGNTATFEFHLLIFCGTKKSIHPADIIKKINDTIQSQIGKAFFVDNIYLFPLFPRRAENNTIDEDWCCLQYLNGGLNRKSKDELFLGLSGIRAHVFEH